MRERGIHRTELEIRALTDFVPGEGTRESALARTLEKLGAGPHLAGCAEPPDLDAFLDRVPFLVMVRATSGRHWVIVDGVEGGCVLVRDPSDGGEGSIRRKDFEDLWMLTIHRIVYRVS